MVQCQNKKCLKNAIDLFQSRYYCAGCFFDLAGRHSNNEGLSEEQVAQLDEEGIARLWLERLQTQLNVVEKPESKNNLEGQGFWWQRD